MERWINTKVVIDIHSGKVIEERGFWYDGPLALATNPPIMEVTNWAFYNDGTESGSVIIGSVNQNPTLNVDTIYFVRFGLEETSGNESKNEGPQLQYNLNGGGWNNVTDVSSVVQAVATANIADLDDTTQRITPFTFDTSNKGFDEVDGIAGGPTCDLVNTGFEALFSFQILSGDVADEDTIVLKIVDSNDGDADYDIYNQANPTITVSEVGQTFYQNVGQGAISPTGVLIKKTSVAMGGHSMNMTGVLATAILFIQNTGQGSVAIAGTLSTILTYGSIVGQGVVNIIGILVKKTSKSMGNGQVSIAGTLIKKTSKSVGGGSVTSIGTLATAIMFTQAVGGASMSIIGSLATQFTAGTGGVFKVIRRRLFVKFVK